MKTQKAWATLSDNGSKIAWYLNARLSVSEHQIAKVCDTPVLILIGADSIAEFDQAMSDSLKLMRLRATIPAVDEYLKENPV